MGNFKSTVKSDSDGMRETASNEPQVLEHQMV